VALHPREPAGTAGLGAQQFGNSGRAGDDGDDVRGVLEDLERGEQALTLRELATDPSVPHGRGGRPASVATLYRQVLRGRNGHRLGTIKTPRGMITTRSEWLRYLSRINGLPRIDDRPRRSPGKRDRDVGHAFRTLSQMGVA
jgi:hypothetical protein